MNAKDNAGQRLALSLKEIEQQKNLKEIKSLQSKHLGVGVRFFAKSEKKQNARKLWSDFFYGGRAEFN